MSGIGLRVRLDFMKLEFGYGHDRGHMSESGLEICLDSI